MNIDLHFTSLGDFLLAWLQTCWSMVLSALSTLLAPSTIWEHFLQVGVLVFLLLALISWIWEHGFGTDYDSDAPFFTEAEIQAHLESFHKAQV